MTRYMLTEPAFIGNALLDAGSIITDDDLPEGPEMTPGHWEGEHEERKWVQAAPKEDGDIIRSKPPKSSIEVDEAGRPVNKRDVGKIAAAQTSDFAPAVESNDAAAVRADQIAESAKAATQPQRRSTGARNA